MLAHKVKQESIQVGYVLPAYWGSPLDRDFPGQRAPAQRPPPYQLTEIELNISERYIQ